MSHGKVTSYSTFFNFKFSLFAQTKSFGTIYIHISTIVGTHGFYPLRKIVFEIFGHTSELFILNRPCQKIKQNRHRPTHTSWEVKRRKKPANRWSKVFARFFGKGWYAYETFWETRQVRWYPTIPKQGKALSYENSGVSDESWKLFFRVQFLVETIVWQLYVGFS